MAGRPAMRLSRYGLRTSTLGGMCIRRPGHTPIARQRRHIRWCSRSRGNLCSLASSLIFRRGANSIVLPTMSTASTFARETSLVLAKRMSTPNLIPSLRRHTQFTYRAQTPQRFVRLGAENIELVFLGEEIVGGMPKPVEVCDELVHGLGELRCMVR